jgi:CO/xanthine dehydrogenase Mo-binding subunit
VAAIDEATAEKAARLIKMKVRELPAYFTAAAAVAPDVQLHEKSRATSSATCFSS